MRSDKLLLKTHPDLDTFTIMAFMNTRKLLKSAEDPPAPLGVVAYENIRWILSCSDVKMHITP